MPYFPTVNEIPAQKQRTEVFGGYDHRLRIPEGSFYEMENLSSRRYPLLTTRQRRGTYASPAACGGLIAKDALCWVDGTDFLVNGAPVQGLTLTASGPRQLLSMGAYVIIMPDKKYVNTADLTDFGSMEAHFTTVSPTALTLCDSRGQDYENAAVGDIAPQSPANMDYWIDTSAAPHVLRQWSANDSVWAAIPDTFVKLASPGIGESFAPFDGVFLSGITAAAELNGSAVIQSRGADFLVVAGILDRAAQQEGPVSVERTVPEMDYLTEAGNRLWGCRYGADAQGRIVNEIYACRLGDFKNWNAFPGLSTDSYAASCGTDGPFTGACTHLGYPIFWKEHCLHKVYGSEPANFRIQSTACRGVQSGCGRSLAIVNGILYYAGPGGVCAYDGSLPREVSACLGDVRFTAATAGCHGNKYYLSACDAQNEWNLYVYDTGLGLWHREDHTHADAWCDCREELYYVDHDSGEIRTVLGSGTPEAGELSWAAETGLMEGSEKQKYVSRLLLRMALAPGGEVRAWIRYDGSPRWEPLWTVAGTGLRTFSVPVRPRRCDHFRLRLTGRGEMTLYSLTRSVETGSDEV